MASDNYGVPQISEAVSSDPASAATVLRLANSPLSRRDGPPIAALGRAIHRKRCVKPISMAARPAFGASSGWDCERAERGVQLVRIEPGAGDGPVVWRELEVPIAWPVRQDA